MRIAIPGVARHDPPFTFTFEGDEIRAYAGESVASALIAADQWHFRETISGDARGLFCGMGVCGECRVRIGGESRRACLEPARPGLQVLRSPARAPIDAEQPGDTQPRAWNEIRAGVLVIGAGPAGLAAATTAASAGLDVVLLDERSKAGGQFFKQPGEGFGIDEHAIDRQFAEGRRLVHAARQAGVRFLHGATVWGAFTGDAMAFTQDGRTHVVTAQRIVIATGAYERAAAIPGWTLPGYITTGAAQTLLRAHQTAPGTQVLIAGNGPLNFQVAHELVQAGVRVVAVVEAAPSPWRAPLAAIRMAATAPTLLMDGWKQLGSLRGRGVPLYYGHALVAVAGDRKVRSATITRLDSMGAPVPGSERQLDVDAVCVNVGFLPQAELARALGCEFTYDAAGASLRATRDEEGRSSVAHVFIVGDAGGLGGARVALAQGIIAGAAIARELAPGFELPALGKARRTLKQHRRFQAALWRMFAAPPLVAQFATSDTLLCRCEEISCARLQAALREQPAGLGTLKRATRTGMGRCQGRYCTSLVAALMRSSGAAVRAEDFFAPRAPFKPVSVAQAAGAYGDELPSSDVLSTGGRTAHK
jgi:NADPH-dependent 2,4-dienoyl-CoA reductase/sulfur reductase-like enzyme